LIGNIDRPIARKVAPNQNMVKYTLVGDANLDGIVNFADFAVVLKNFAQRERTGRRANFEYAANSPSIQGTNFNDFADVLKNFLQAPPRRRRSGNNRRHNSGSIRERAAHG